MILYSPKGTKNWTSSGVVINNLKLEMSSFSFIEETFTASLTSYVLAIIGKNIIGSGNVTVSIYKDGELYLTESILFNNSHHSKKQFNMACILGTKIKVLLSRGGHSKGKVLIHQASLYDGNIIDTEVVEPLPLPITQPVSSEQTTFKAKKERKKREKKTKQEEPIVAVESVCITKRDRISAVIIDLNTINDERDMFNFINQINFGKNTQRFFIRQSVSDPKDLTKYNNVALFLDEQDLISEIDNFDVFKLFFNKGNLSGALLEKAEEIKRALA